MHRSATIFAGIILATAGQAAVLHVPGQYPTIQSAIQAATNGDTVLVAPGSYLENLDFLGKAIAVRSSGGAAVTTIDGNSAGSVVSFTSGEGRNSLLEGFTITNGTGALAPAPLGSGLGGGGILCIGASPTIRGNVVTGNALSGGGALGGAGIVCTSGSSPLITANEICGNTITGGSYGGGGGIASLLNSSPIITANSIHDNDGGGSQFFGGGGINSTGGAATITNNSIFRNICTVGGGIQISHNSTDTIASNVLFDNTARASGGGIDCYMLAVPLVLANNTVYGNRAQNSAGGMRCSGCASVTLSSSILWGNTAPSGAELALYNSALTVRYSDVQGGQAGVYLSSSSSASTWGAGNFALDPLCANPAGMNFSLPAGSRCIDAGDPQSGACCEKDFLGNPRVLDGDLDLDMRIDMGAHEFSNVRLAMSGSVTPGGTLTFTTTHTPGLALALFIGTGPGQYCASPWGGLFFDLASPWFLFSPVPASFTVSLHPPVTTPLGIVVQEVAINPANWAGNSSNAIEL